jgi:hypothetical protein
MKVKDILKLFEGIDAETEVQIMSFVDGNYCRNIADGANIAVDVDEGNVTMSVGGAETDYD